MKSIIWKVQIKNAPAVARYCKRCGAVTQFASTGLFRVNAQQKNLDIWLVYRCTTCDSTWNLTVLSRVSSRSIPAEMLRGFSDNDLILAKRYAADTSLLKRNGAEPGQPEVEIIGEAVVASDYPLRIHLVSELSLELKASAVLRKKLDLSRKEFDRMIESGKLICTSGHDLKKCKLAGEIIVETVR